jgi:DNA invertase Pin-like site-specific DNA recombinase
MMGVFSEFERAILVERINAGTARAHQVGTKSGKAIGRAKVSPEPEVAVRDALAAGTSILRTAKLVGVGVSVVQRIKAAHQC